MIKKLTQNGIMSETKKLIEKGSFFQIESTIPEISSVAWSSIITGKNPGEHGIFGYTDIPVGTYRLTFPNFNNLKAIPFWEQNPEDFSIIINVPSTFPVRPMNGVHISGFVSLDLERSVYPKILIPELEKRHYQIDVDASKAHKSYELFLLDLDRTLKARINTYRWLWDQYDWQNFMLVFTGTDRLAHFLWDAYEDKQHRYRAAFLDHFKQIDAIIGEIYSNLNEDDILIILSDHGFESLKTEVNINYILRENGFLKLDPSSRRGFAELDADTKAFALEPSRIYLNLKEKYSKGNVDPKDRSPIIKDLITLFSELYENEIKVIKHICLAEDIYKGEYSLNGPDLVLLSSPGYNLKTSLKSIDLFENRIFTGKHTQNDAFFICDKTLSGKTDLTPNSVTDMIDTVSFIKKKYA